MERTRPSTKKATIKSGNPLSGKVSVKHFLNTKLKPRTDYNIKQYPVYVQVVFNRKNSSLRSLYPIFTEENLKGEADVFQYLRTAQSYSQGGSFLSAKNFESEMYKSAFDVEAKIITEIVQCYGQFGENILIDNPGGFIISSLPYIRNVFSELLWTEFKRGIEISKVDPDIKDLLNRNIPFDKQFEVLNKYGNTLVKEVLDPFVKSYEMTQKLKEQKNIRVYEWLNANTRSRFLANFAHDSIFIDKLKMAVVHYYKEHLLIEHRSLYKLIVASL